MDSPPGPDGGGGPSWCGWDCRLSMAGLYHLAGGSLCGGDVGSGSGGGLAPIHMAVRRRWVSEWCGGRAGVDEKPSTTANVAMRASEVSDDEWSQVLLCTDGGGSGSSLRQLLSEHLPTLLSPVEVQTTCFPVLQTL